MNIPSRITLLIASILAGPLACGGDGLEVPATPDGVTLGEARALFDAFCPEAGLLAEDADPNGLDALYIYDVTASPLRLGERNTITVAVANLGDAVNTAAWGVQARAGGALMSTNHDGRLAPCGQALLQVDVEVGDDVADGATVEVVLSIVGANGAGHRVTAYLPVDVDQLYARLCADGPYETDAEHADLGALYIIGVSSTGMDLVNVDVVNLSDVHYGGDWGVRIGEDDVRMESEIRMRPDRPGVAPCDRERLIVAVDDAARLIGQQVHATIIDRAGNEGHRVSTVLR